MIVGSPIIHPGSATKYFSPAFPRGGQAATFSVDVKVTGDVDRAQIPAGIAKVGDERAHVFDVLDVRR